MKAGGSTLQRMRSQRNDIPPKIDLVSYSSSRENKKIPNLRIEKENRRKLKIRVKQLREKVKEITRDDDENWRQEVKEI